MTADSLHWAAWDSSLAWGDTIPAVRFAYYASRTLVVPQPEVYLCADTLFSTVVENLPGSAAAYGAKNARDLKMFQRLAHREPKKTSFTWRQWTIVPDSVFDSDNSVGSVGQSWRDRRLPSASVLLQTYSPRLSTLEASVLRYLQMRRLGRRAEGMYVVIGGRGEGYLVDDTVCLSAGLKQIPQSDLSLVAPILVFNEKSVFYPLFGRDDRGGDAALARLVGRLQARAPLNLSPSDSTRITRLRQAADLTDAPSRQLAVLIASGLVDVDNPQIRAAWMGYLGSEDSITVACAAITASDALFWADRLSPLTAELAVTAGTGPLDVALPAVQKEYLSTCGRPAVAADTTAPTEAWGILWSYGLLETAFDDLARTRAGSALSQAAAMSAILHLAGIPHCGLAVHLGGEFMPDQDCLIAGDGEFLYELGVWNRIPDTISTLLRRDMAITGYMFPGRSVRFVPTGVCSEVDNLTVLADLTRIFRWMPHANLAIMLGPKKVIPYAQFMQDLSDDQYRQHPVRWPLEPPPDNPPDAPK
ncbi:MAG: hypothetical protein HY304_04205 [candidate division Zixibacteria bacterium]|nr:hypothetical protein [candidate division Zixibacteria bacterium]